MVFEGTGLSRQRLAALKQELLPLIGTQFDTLMLPSAVLSAFEPSQIGTIVGSLMDALIPHLDNIPQVGLSKHAGLLGEREGYPDYIHASGLRVELKLLYVDNPNLTMKRPPTRREPSARLTQKVTVKNVIPDRDALLIIAYQLNPHWNNPGAVTPTIVDLDVFSVIELVRARDDRLTNAGGRWFGNYETPCVLSRIGKEKYRRNLPLSINSYGRKESEGKDYNEDTNFGKLKRIPHADLQLFLRKCIGIGVGMSERQVEMAEIFEDDEDSLV